jgi:uncharacterized protein YihD (DUF1040 family)
VRDPVRIDAMLGTIAKYWKQHPDLRLGQLISNALEACGHYPGKEYLSYVDGTDNVLFYIEDNAMHNALIAQAGGAV